jgi:hypothetical protein
MLEVAFSEKVGGNLAEKADGGFCLGGGDCRIDTASADVGFKRYGSASRSVPDKINQRFSNDCYHEFTPFVQAYTTEEEQ